ncbi:MAG: cytochrome c1, partial [Burkholderiaceae bacterium]
MKKIITALSLVLSLVGGVQAAGGDVQLDKAPDRSKDMGALQNGAKLFVNYCIGCHSAEYLRYNRLRDIGLTEV